MANVVYEHSLVFASLKHVQSSLGTDTDRTQDYLDVLDQYLHKALSAVLSNHFDGFLLKVLGWQWYNHRRKASHLEKEEFSQQVLRYLALPSIESKIDFLPTLKLDRIFAIKYCQIFTSLDLDPVPSPLASFTLHRTYAHYEEDYRLLGKVRECRYWLNKALEYKAQLCAKYTKLAIKTARADFVEYGLHPLDDWCMSYVVAVNRAIDKCDWQQGALPTMALAYMKSMRNLLLGSVVNTKPLDENSTNVITLHDEEQDTQSNLRALKVFDPTNLAHLTYGILPYHNTIWKDL